MGRNTDKLYITKSEWAQGSHSASSGKRGAGEMLDTTTTTTTKSDGVPFWTCSISLSAIQKDCGVCDLQGRVFDIKNILPRLKKYGDTNPIDGSALCKDDLVKLRIETNSKGKYIDPVSFKEFQPNTQAVVIKTSGWVYAKSTVDEFNVKPKVWTDLMTDQEFKKRDILELTGGVGIIGADKGGSTEINSDKRLKTELKTVKADKGSDPEKDGKPEDVPRDDHTSEEAKGEAEATAESTKS